jgi:hypothetical protein
MRPAQTRARRAGGMAASSGVDAVRAAGPAGQRARTYRMRESAYTCATRRLAGGEHGRRIHTRREPTHVCAWETYATTQHPPPPNAVRAELS